MPLSSLFGLSRGRVVRIISHRNFLKILVLILRSCDSLASYGGCCNLLGNFRGHYLRDWLRLGMLHGTSRHHNRRL